MLRFIAVILMIVFAGSAKAYCNRFAQGSTDWHNCQRAASETAGVGQQMVIFQQANRNLAQNRTAVANSTKVTAQDKQYFEQEQKGWNERLLKQCGREDIPCLNKGLKARNDAIVQWYNTYKSSK